MLMHRVESYVAPAEKRPGSERAKDWIVSPHQQIGLGEPTAALGNAEVESAKISHAKAMTPAIRARQPGLLPSPNEAILA